MQSGAHVQQVWDSFVTHLKELSESLSTAHDVFSQPEEDLKGMSFTTLKRRKHKSLESLSKGKENVDQLLMQASQVYSVTSHWQSQVDTADSAKQEAVSLLATVQHDLQGALHRIHALEALRQQLTADMDSARQLAADREAEVRSLSVQNATLVDDVESAQLRAAKAESRMHELHEETQHTRDAASQALAQEQAASSRVKGLQAEATKARALGERHQEMVATLTADNLVFLMRLKRCEGDLTAAVQERDELRLEVQEQRGPWIEEVRLGVEERVKAAMSHGEALQAELDSLKAGHDSQLAEAGSHMSQLHEQIAQQQQQLDATSQAMSRSQEALGRSEEAAGVAQDRAAELQQRLDGLAAENRVLAEASRSMCQECNEAWIKQEAACGRVDGLLDQVAALQDEVSSLQDTMKAQASQLQNHMAMNQQLMKRKEDMEWQLMSVLAQGNQSMGHVPVKLRTHASTDRALADRTNQSSLASNSGALPTKLHGTGKGYQLGLSAQKASLASTATDAGTGEGAAGECCTHKAQQGLNSNADEPTSQSYSQLRDSSRQQHDEELLTGAAGYDYCKLDTQEPTRLLDPLQKADLHAQSSKPAFQSENDHEAVQPAQGVLIHTQTALSSIQKNDNPSSTASPGRRVFTAQVTVTRPTTPGSPAWDTQ